MDAQRALAQVLTTEADRVLAELERWVSLADPVSVSCHNEVEDRLSDPDSARAREEGAVRAVLTGVHTLFFATLD